jgi:hypothetical protein
MVKVIGYSLRENKGGKEFFSLNLQSGITVVKSKQSGKFYATAKKCSIPSTFDEQTCKSLIGEEISGTIQKQTCEPYEFTDKETGEIIELNHHWVYLPEGASMEEAIFEGDPQSVLV